ncbi:MAG: hypothetical protein U0163_17160 [Gemmatimonadaceae bacterium]
MESLFAGRFPGVAVSRTDNGGLQIRIRGGAGTFYSGEEPLYVIDGTPLHQAPAAWCSSTRTTSRRSKY